MIKEKYIPLAGGINERLRGVGAPVGHLTRGWNVECKREGGYRRLLGYAKYDSTVVPGEGAILGVQQYGNKVYAVRNAVGGATAVMFESAGSGWTTLAGKTDYPAGGLTAGGDFYFENAVFDGVEKMYGVSGVDKAFQYDGTTYTEVTTGMATDTPNLLKIHRKRLLLSFGSSLQFSPVGDPAGTWVLTSGTAEMLMNGTITGMMHLTGGALGIFSRNSTAVLSGDGASAWALKDLSEYGNKIGCIANSIQQMGSRVYYWDDRGIVDFYTSDKYGDFEDSTISELITPTIYLHKDDITASCVVRNKSQVRYFWDDGFGLIGKFDKGKLKGWTYMKFPLVVRKVHSTEDSNGDEVIYFGSDDGYIYQMESGNTFDGTAIQAHARVGPMHLGTPRDQKQFLRTMLDIQAVPTTGLQGKVDFLFDQDIKREYETPCYVGFAGPGLVLGIGILGTNVLGEQDELAEGTLDTPGEGSYVAISINSSSNADPWEVDGVTYEWKKGRQRRGC